MSTIEELQKRVDDLEGEYDQLLKAKEKFENQLIDCEQELDECWEEIIGTRAELYKLKGQT